MCCAKRAFRMYSQKTVRLMQCLLKFHDLAINLDLIILIRKVFALFKEYILRPRYETNIKGVERQKK